jgi:polysaccharide biosynthesis/export protein
MFHNRSDRACSRSTTFTRLSSPDFAGWLALLFLILASMTGTRLAQAQAPAGGLGPMETLGPGDLVQIVVYGQADLGEAVTVSEKGTVHVGLVGDVKVAGLSPAEASTQIEKAFRDGSFLNDPHVTITVTKSRSDLVTVTGAVKTAGRYPVDTRTTVLDLLALAGGVDEEKAGNVADLVRTNADGTVTHYTVNIRGDFSDPAESTYQSLQGGDRLIVPDAAHYLVDGEVKSTGKFRIDPGMTVRQAIARAGGVTALGSMHRIDITRVDPQGKQVTRHAQLDEPVQPNDVLHVKESIF